MRLARWIVVMIVLAQPGLLLAQGAPPPQTDLNFKRTFRETKFIKEAKRPAVVNLVEDPTFVRVTFRTGEIPPQDVPGVGVAAAPPEPPPGDPCAASVEMFTKSVHKTSEDDSDGPLPDVGIPQYTLPLLLGNAPVIHGVFCHPTIFVCSTVFAIAQGGDVLGAGGGEWALKFFTDYPPGVASTSPVTQDITGTDISRLFQNSKAIIVGPPVPNYPILDTTSVLSWSIFGTYNEFMVFEDCPATFDWFGGKVIGELTLATTDSVQWRSDFETYFAVHCRLTSGSPYEWMLGVRWNLRDLFAIAAKAEDTTANEMYGNIGQLYEIRPTPPRPVGRNDQYPTSTWVLLSGGR